MSYRASQQRTLVWDQARIISLPFGKGVLVPIRFVRPLLIKTNFGGDHPFNLDYLTQLLLFRDKAGYHAQVVTSLPDSSFLRHPGPSFRGMIWVEDWQGNDLAKYQFTDMVRKYQPSSKRAASMMIQNCYSVTGYNYSADDPSIDYAWTEDAGCSYEYIPDLSSPSDALNGPSYGNMAPGAEPITVNLKDAYVAIGNNPIGNVVDYLKCFTSASGSDHQYTVSLCVDQPLPGTRVPWVIYGRGSSGSSSGGNPVNAGHVFLVFTENYGTTPITRNIGFYPTTIVLPGSTASQGMLNDDEAHAYNISGTFSVNNDQFFNMLSYVQQGNNPGYLYDLNTNNCTSFALQTLLQGGVNINSTIGTWAGGMGYNPGDLGEDLRLQNVPGMTLTNSPNGNAAHPNVGICF